MEETIVGSKIPRECLGDRLAIELVEQLESVVEQHEDELSRRDVSLEVEGRLGYIIDSDTRQRLQMPIESEAIMMKSQQIQQAQNDTRWNFEPSLPVDKFEELKCIVQEAALHSTQEAINDCARREGASKKGTLSALSFYNKSIQTVDQFVEVPGFEDLLRVSYFGVAGSRDQHQSSRFRDRNDTSESWSLEPDYAKGPIEIINKEKKCEWSVYTGRDEEEDDGGGSTNMGNKQSIDYRIAINLERNHSKLIPKFEERKRRGIKIMFQRERVRESFICKLFNVDTTNVVVVHEVSGSRGPRCASPPVYEFEAELNPTVLLTQLRLKRLGRPHQLYALCSNFLNMMRDWCQMINSNAPQKTVEDQEGFPGLNSPSSPSYSQVKTDLTDAGVSNIAVERYQRYVAPQCPLVGDYLYRRVAATLELCDRSSQENTIAAEDSCLHEKSSFSNPLHHAAESLYIENTQHTISGPWSLLNTIEDMESRDISVPAWCEEEKTQFPLRLQHYL